MKKDPRSQVKTSALAAIADWMENHPKKNEVLINHIAEAFKTATEPDVRAFSYQMLALHSDLLSPALQTQIAERLKTEPDSFNGNLLAEALFTAPDNIRSEAISHAEAVFSAETDMDKKCNLLAQIVCLSRGDTKPLLEQVAASGDSDVAKIAKNYLALLSLGGPLQPEIIFGQISNRSAEKQAALEAQNGHKE